MKKLLALLLVLSMSVSLAACGGNKTEEPAADGSAPEETSGEADADAAEAAAGEDLTWGLTPFEERQTLRLGFFTGSPLSYPFLFADNLGVFDALNIDVE